MAYNTPELRIVGRAAAVVMGEVPGDADSAPETTAAWTEPAEMPLGLDD
jgi:hypothetical protein